MASGAAPAASLARDVRRRAAEERLHMLVGDLGVNYHTPYLTCEKCNRLSFVDMGEFLKVVHPLPYVVGRGDEILLPCFYCGSKAGLHFGVGDYSEEIRMAIDRYRAAEERKHRASTLIQGLWRGHRVRETTRYDLEEIRRSRTLLISTVVKLQSIYRGYVSRLTLKTFRCLARIAAVHPMILELSLRRPDVFWFSNEEELHLLYQDYRLLVQKLGGVPSIREVEVNVSRVLSHIHDIENIVVTRIQKTFRGFLGRICFQKMRLYSIQLMGIQVNSAIVIQSAIRGHLARRFMCQHRFDSRFSSLDLKTKPTAQTLRSATGSSLSRERVMKLYVKESKFARTATMLDLSPAASASGPEAAHASLAYYRDFANAARQKAHAEREERKRFVARYEFMKAKCAENSAFAKYYPIAQARQQNQRVLSDLLARLR